MVYYDEACLIVDILNDKLDDEHKLSDDELKLREKFAIIRSQLWEDQKRLDALHEKGI